MEDFIATAINLAKLSGQIMLDNFVVTTTSSWKPDNSPVTESDTAINQLVLSTLSEQYPGHSIISEEGSLLQPDSDYVWVCDPIDGTIAFAHGIPTAVFSLALVYQGKSILGVVYNPFTGELMTSQEDSSTLLNSNTVSVSGESLPRSMVGIPIWPDQRDADLQIVRNLKVNGAYAFSTGGIIYLGTLVARGSLTGAIYLGTKAHDVAALKIIVENAGGKVTDLQGHEQLYNGPVRGCILSNGVVHPELVKMVDEIAS